MDDLRFTKIILIAFLGLLSQGCKEAKINDSFPDKPNFILINADDLSPHTLGPYGQEIINTPRLDRMARGGTLFHRALSSDIGNSLLEKATEIFRKEHEPNPLFHIET